MHHTWPLLINTSLQRGDGEEKRTVTALEIFPGLGANFGGVNETSGKEMIPFLSHEHLACMDSIETKESGR